MRFDVRAWIDRFIRFWRGSLQLRTIIITVALSGIAVTIIGVYISTSVRTNLFDSRQQQVVAESSRATDRAQEVFLNSAELSTDQDLEGVQKTATDAIARSSTASFIAMLRVPGQDSPSIMENQATFGFEEAESQLVSDALRTSVIEGEVTTEVHWQSVAVPETQGAGEAPGITTGSLLDVPTAGDYQLYLVYSLADVQQTLDFVQQTLIFGGIALVALIGAVAYLIVRLVVGPVRVAAETSEKLAAGQLEERLPERGDDELATLARSFNRMADSMQRQIKQLADLSRVQQRFVSDVSHELRTPLTTIRLAGDVLYDQRETFPPATARTAELLHAQTERFELLLADLLEMSRYDAGAVTLETEPTNIVHLVEGAIDAVAPLADEKRHRDPAGRTGRLLRGGCRLAPDPSHPSEPAGQRDRPRRGPPDRGLRRQRRGCRGDRGARLRGRNVHDRHGTGLRSFLAGGPVAAALDRRYRSRPRDLARGCGGARRRARRVVGARPGELLPTHHPAGPRREADGVAPRPSPRCRPRAASGGGIVSGRTGVRRVLAGIAAASVALLLGACVGLPTGGPVSTETVDTTVDEASLLSLPESPRPARVPSRSSRGSSSRAAVHKTATGSRVSS